MIDIQGIVDCIPHRYPFLLIDRVLEVEPGKRVVAFKNVTIIPSSSSNSFSISRSHGLFPGIMASVTPGGKLLMFHPHGFQQRFPYLGIM